MVREELSRAIKNWRFLIGLALVIGIVLVHQVLFIIPQSQYLDLFQDDPMLCPHSLFNKWIGLDFGCFMSLVLYWSLPLIVAFPFADSFLVDAKKGYAENLLIRCSRSAYLRAKLLAVGVTSAVLVAVPLVLDLFLTAAWMPAIFPQPITNTFPITFQSMWSELYYTQPWIYIVCYSMLDVIFISTTVVFSVAIGVFCSNNFEVLLIPFLLYLISYFLCMWLNVAEFSPMFFIFPHQPMWGMQFWIIAAEWLVMLAVIICFYFREKRHDICI